MPRVYDWQGWQIHTWTDNTTAVYNWATASNTASNLWNTYYGNGWDDNNTSSDGWHHMGWTTVGVQTGATEGRGGPGGGGGGNHSVTMVGAGGAAGGWATERTEAVVRAAREAEQARREARIASRTEATSRAEALLCGLLGPDQRESYELRGYFEIIGSAGTVYRVHRGTVGNVAWLRPDGEEGGRLCAHPNMAHQWLPDPDVALSQLLALTTDELAWLRRANLHRGDPPPIRAGAAA